MESERSLLERLRNRIVGALHVGYLHPGDRLPSYRQLSREWEVDHRPVARAYRALEAEGLVEVRGRSGVFLAEQEQLGGGMLPETARWLAGEVLMGAWRRRIRIPDLPDFVRRCTAAVELRCACVESSADHRVILCTELEEQLGFETHSVSAGSLPDFAPGEPVRTEGLPEEVREADLLVTTTFHGAQAHAVAEALGKPSVAVSVHPDVVKAIEHHLREAPLTVVCSDPLFGERVRRIYGREYPEDRIRVVLARDRDAVAALPPEEPVLLTTAAHREAGPVRPPLLVPLSLALSADSMRELAMLLIRLNLEKSDAK